MQLKIGYDIVYEVPQRTPMLLVLNVHYSRASDIVVPDHVRTDPATPITGYRDSFGNWCHRLVAPPGSLRIWTESVINDRGEPDPRAPAAGQHPVEQLPEETLIYLLGSRYCDTDRLSDTAWRLFADGPTGWQRVQRICDYVHGLIQFGYEHADATRTAGETLAQRRGVCRDFAHLAIAFCRCMNIPARYCTGYLSDVGVPPPHAPMDFAAWFEAYLEGGWHGFDPRNNTPRRGRVLMARGRDAADVAITTTFGPATLKSFSVTTEELAAR